MEHSKPKKKPKSIDDLTKEQLRQAIVKKRECNAKAQEIVESLLETNISAEKFTQCLPDINQSHFDDVTEERSILHYCGYPICNNKIKDTDIPKQKYRISLKTNKVYDITERKRFCSNSCYKAAVYVKNQMLTSPLWFREYEEIPEFRLLPLNSVGALGEELDIAIHAKLDINQSESSTIIESKNIVNNSVDQPIENKQNIALEPNCDDKKQEQMDVDIHSAIELTCENKPEKYDNNNSRKISSTKSNPLNIVGDIIEKPEKQIDPILLDDVTPSKKIKNSTKTRKKEPALKVLTNEVEECLGEWFTIDSLLFLLGEDKVKELLADKGECIKDYLRNYAKSIFYNSNTYDQYQALCKKLNMLDLEDRKYDSTVLQKEMKPLPDYSILKEESKKLQLKVNAFLAGETEIPQVDNTEQPEPSKEDDNVTQLPLVDKNCQNSLRRKIVCQHLNKMLPDLLRSLGLLTLSISSDLRLLVNTFKLRADNIMFKPIQWTVITLVIIKLLSLKDMRLQYLMQQPTAHNHMQLLLLSFKQDGGYLDRLVSWLTDINRLLDYDDTLLSVD